MSRSESRALVGVKEIAGEIESTTDLVVSGVKSFARKVTAQCEEDLRELEQFRNTEIGCLPETRFLCQNLIQASSSAYAFIDRVDDVSWRFQNSTRIERIKRAARRGDFNELQDFLDDIQGILADAESKHLQFEKDCEEVRKSADDAAARCSRKANEAKRKKKVTQAAGGAAAAGGFAAAGVGLGGVIASIVVGIATAGIGTPIVLGATAAATAAVAGGSVGVVSTVATVHIAEEYEASMRTFQRYSSTFYAISEAALRLLNAVSETRDLMERTGKTLDDVERCWRNHRVRESFLEAIDILFEEGTLMYNQTAPYRDKAKQVKERVEQML